MKTVNIHEAKTTSSKLLELVAAGEEVVIAKAGTPVARLISVSESSSRPRFGTEKGRFTIPADFDVPLPKEVLELFYK